jgi:hypothetical protein
MDTSNATGRSGGDVGTRGPPIHMTHRTWRDALDVDAVVFEGRPGWQRVVKNAHVVRATYEMMCDVWTDGFR